MENKKSKHKETKEKIIINLSKNPSHMYPFYSRSTTYHAKNDYNTVQETIATKATVHRAKNDLLENNLIKIVKKEERGGPDKSIFGLTLFGMLIGYTDKILTIKHVSNIINTFKEDLPLVFGEWEYFKEKGVEKIAKKHLIHVLKYCGKDYRRFLEDWKEDTIQQKNIPTDMRKEIIETWDQEKNWAKQITSKFLYSGFSDNPSFRKEFHSNLTFDEQTKLRNAIDKNEKLHNYCLMLSRKSANSHFSQSTSFHMYNSKHELLWDAETITTKIYGKLQDRMLEKNGYLNPLQKISNLAMAEDWFSVSFEFFKLFENYLFNSKKDAVQTIFISSENLAELRYSIFHTGLNKKEIYEKLTPHQKKKMNEHRIDFLTAYHFFTFKSIKVWDKTYYQLEPKEELINSLKEEREKTIETTKVIVTNLFKKMEDAFSPEKRG